MFRMRLQAAACAMAMGVASIGAAEAGVYAGANFGKAAYESSDWEDGSAKQFLLGYEFGALPFFVEAALIDSGDSKITNTNASVNVEARQLGGGVMLRHPSGSGVFLRAGFYDAESTVIVPGPDLDYSNNGNYYGVGGLLMFHKNVGVRVDWQRLNKVDHYDEQNVTFTTVGAMFKFGQ